MFRSKIPALLSTFVNKVQRETASTGLVLCRSCSTTVNPGETSPTQKEQPDKLYKQISLEMRGHDRAVMRSYSLFAIMTANHLNIKIVRNAIIEKPVFERMTLLKSVHVHKKHRVQYETRTYFRYLDVVQLTGSTADTFLEYIERNLPEGVALKVTKVELQKLPESVLQATQPQSEVSQTV